MDLPQCPSCDASDTLEHVWTEMGTEHYRCTCCAKQSWIDSHGRAQRSEPVLDVSGHLVDGP